METDTLILTNTLVGIGLAVFKGIIEQKPVTRELTGVLISSILLAVLSFSGLDALARPLSMLLLLVVGYNTLPTVLDYVRTFK